MCLHEEVESVGEFGTVYNYPCVPCVFILFFFWVLLWERIGKDLVVWFCVIARV